MRPRHLGMLAAVAALPALSFGQGLADAAKKEQERRAKAGAAASKVLDETDLKTTKGQLANAASSAEAAVPARPESRPTQEPAKRSLAQDEADRLAKEQFWKNEASRRRQQLARLERDVQQAERWSDPTYAGPDAPS